MKSENSQVLLCKFLPPLELCHSFHFKIISQKVMIFAFDATREISTILILMTHMALYFQNLKQMLNTNVEIIGKIDLFLQNCIIKTSCLAMIHVTITTEEVACWYCSFVVSQRFVKKNSKRHSACICLTFAVIYNSKQDTVNNSSCYLQ